MKKFVLTSPKFTGQIIIGYGTDGVMVYYSNDATFTFKQHVWFLNRMPFMENQIHELAKAASCELLEVPQDTTFETFYNTYDKKRNANRCKPLYEKLADNDKLKAILAIKPYFDFCKRTGYRSIADPDTYIRQRYFDTGWTKER